MKLLKNGLIAFSLFALSVNYSEAKVTLPSVFSDNMIFQQKTNSAVWGKTNPGKKVTVSGTWNGKKYTTIADDQGNWKVNVLTPSFGGPYEVNINDGDLTVLRNVLIGEVWVCSGQSNMEMPLAGWGQIDNYQKEISEGTYPQIRLLQAVHVTSNKSLENAEVTNGGWQPCRPETVKDFSSTAYFFAREIYQKTKVPIGLIHTSWGGTIAEAWTSAGTLKQLPDFAQAAEEIKNTSEQTKEDYAKRVQDWEVLALTKDAGYNQNKPVWATNDFDASSWKSMSLPVLWEKSALPDFDGAVWFRKKIMIPAEWAGKDLKLNLGAIDDDDVTWFNGAVVGKTSGYTLLRKYIIPGSLVKTGENIITVRVFDGAGGGGIYGDVNDLSLAPEGGKAISLAGDWQYEVGAANRDFPTRPATIDGPNRPTVLYNAMIHPFIQFAVKGFIWYQGESNAGRAYQYRELFPAMIKDWRKSWGGDDKPFYFVQLANFTKIVPTPAESDWAELREAQLKTLALPNTGMAVTIDVGNAEDIHPKNKQDVGKRLAYIALAKTYGVKVPFTGPVFKSQKVEGSKIKISFSGAEGGLKTKNNAPVIGFAIAGADKKYHWAKAVIVGNQLIVSSDEVPNPVAVRYAWANNPVSNLVNGAGLPASPFRTDNWKGITFGKK